MKPWREEDRQRQAARIQAMDDYERGVVALAGLGYAVVVIALDVSLVVVAAGAIRRAWRQRQLGPARAVVAGLVPASGWAAGLIGAQVAGAAAAVWVVNRQLAAHVVPPGPPGAPDPPGVPDPPAPR
jgi:anti-sigma factor RsiW